VQEQVDPEKLRQQAVEMILESASLTDDLTDEEARPLIAWGLDQAEAAADAVVASQRISVSHLPPTVPAADLHAALAVRVGPVRRAMKAISALTADRRELSSQEMAGELESIRTLAGELPAHALLTISDTGLAELGARQAGLNNAAFVQALLALLETGHSRQEQETDQTAETRVTNDR
jgi:hypothetical protein